MQTIETTGKSVAEATAAAAKQLGASPDALKVTVLEEHKGLFGKSIIRIRAEVEGSSGGGATAVVEAPAAEEAPAPAAPAKEKGGRGKKAKAAPAPEEAKAPEPAPAAEESESGEAVAMEATEEDAQRILGLIVDLLKSGSLEVTAKVSGMSGRYVNIELDGRDVAHLVGKHGEVLNSLQYVINIIANQQFGKGIRATLDGNNYRHKREEALTKMATRIAEQVRERGEEAVLEALPAFERRIVHKALSELDGVSTYSEGEEPNRRVVIAPAD